MMQRDRAFQSAAARRKASPVTFTIDDVTLRLVDRCTIEQYVELLDVMSASVESMKDPENPDAELTSNQQVILKKNALINEGERFVVGSDQAAWRDVAGDLDFPTLNLVMEGLSQEYSGRNPTSPESSSDGSPATSSSSTDGVSPEESTPPSSPSTD